MENSIGEATIEVIDRDDVAASSAVDTLEVLGDDLLDDEQLIEEISIDGMCGVY